MLLSDAFRIGGLDARCLARNHSGALVDDAASGQASDQVLIRCAKRRRFTLELWSTTLRQAKHRIRSLFAAPSVAASLWSSGRRRCVRPSIGSGPYSLRQASPLP